ncbi:DinB family protein [Cytobacillus purgationiresistens]|uniref:Damage-inducible protein DinB n=1 Tax=Cytobacillus purgationiresistens TaxID=863449 RepID=A0ABU0ARM1_9BACI|nr:DinB family protein [Cytobacillus purgationiresistens]MDQ0273912.1 putative damage-inducible protein DinB [Cytobacillus purgationiresistens]
MSDTYVLNLFADIRKQILNVLKNVSEGKMKHIPKGFNNHLYWQVGHVLTITDKLIFEYSGAGSRIPDHYSDFFATGTSPLNWSGQPPEIDLILIELKSQLTEICDNYDGMLTQPVAEESNFLQATVIGELVHVLIAHESTHLGMITAMVKVLQNE